MVTSDPRARLLDLVKQGDHSLAALSSMIGRNSTYLQQFIRKGSPRKLDEEDRRLLAEFFGVPESELGGAEENSSAPRDPAAPRNWIAVPRLALGASAGPGALADAEARIGAFMFDPRWLRDHGLSAAMLSAIRVEGDSMEPLLRDGDEILVDRTPRSWRDGVHVVRVGEGLLVKRMVTGRPGVVTLLSENAAYPPMELPAGDVQVIGRVVWKGGRL